MTARPNNANSSNFEGFNRTAVSTRLSPTLDELEQLRYIQSFYNAYNLYVPPVLMVLGTVGNLVSLFVLNQPNYRRTSTGFYMMSLALADWHYVSNGLIHHYLRRNFGSVVVSTLFCRSLLFFLFCGSALSSWTLVLMTYDRMVAIVFPLKAPVLCTKTRAKIALSIAAVVNLGRAIPCLFWGNFIYSRTLDYWTCDLVLPHRTYYHIYYNESTVGNQWLPFSLLLLANTRILLAVSRSNAQRKSLIGDNNVSKLRGQEGAITIMLLSNTFAFLLFCLPYQIDFIFWKYIFRWRTFLDRHYRVMTWNVAYLVRFLNPTVNFYLYLLSSSKFRREVKVLFLGTSKRRMI
jgi:hypothetical protein